MVTFLFLLVPTTLFFQRYSEQKWWMVTAPCLPLLLSSLHPPLLSHSSGWALSASSTQRESQLLTLLLLSCLQSFLTAKLGFLLRGTSSFLSLVQNLLKNNQESACSFIFLRSVQPVQTVKLLT